MAGGTRLNLARLGVMPPFAAQNMLAIQVLAARFRRHAAETSLEAFRRKFEAAVEERQVGTALAVRPNLGDAGFPGTGSGHEYGH